MKVTTVDYGRDGPVIDGKRLIRVTTYEGLAGERGTHEGVRQLRQFPQTALRGMR